jgi:hypothetical protein
VSYVYLKLIVILIIAGSGFIRWVVVQLQEQAAKKRAQDDLERRAVESLRTGRNLEPVDPRAERARLEAEAATKRQAQIEEFRRRQQERARQRVEAPHGSTVAAAPSVPRPAPKPAPKPAAKPAAPPRPQRGPRQLLTPTAAPTPEPDMVRHAQAGGPRQAATGAVASVTPRTPEQWRRAIVASTILTPPPGIGGGEDPWAPVG